MSEQKRTPSLATAKNGDIYKAAVERIVSELERINVAKKEMAIREAQLNESLKALRPLAGEWVFDLSEFSLSNAVRFVFNGLADERSLSAIDVRTKLEDLAYDLSKYENPLASIHTCMRRMVETEELVIKPTDEGNKKQFEAGPQLKSVPDPPGSVPIPIPNSLSSLSPLSAISDLLGDTASQKEKA
jgi:hypothetical protein